ncbi:MAG: hypothetical protein WBV91_20605, partial [Desulfobacterales bacterium]
DPTLHPLKSQTLPIPAVLPKRSSRIRFHILLALVIFVPGSYLLYLDLNPGQSPETLSAPKTIQTPAGQTARKATASFAPLPQQLPSLSSGAVKTPPSEKVSEKTAVKEMPIDGVVVLKSAPETMQKQKLALPQRAGSPFTDKKNKIAPPEKSVSPIVAEKPTEKPIQPTKSPTAPAPLQTEQMSEVNRPASQRKATALKKAPQTLQIPSSETPDPADIVNWLLRQKRNKSGNRPNP